MFTRKLNSKKPATSSKKNRLRRIALSTLVTAVLATSALAAPVAVEPASAAGKFTGYINFHDQCKRQGSYGASFSNYWNPYSWYCYTVSVPPSITFSGGLDLNAACRAQYPTRSYPATWAKVVSGWNINGWRCVNY